MRAPTRIGTKFLTAIGAAPVQMPIPQVTEALAKSVLDGAMVPWEVAPAIKLQEVAKYHLDTAPGVPKTSNSIFVLAMNPAKYDGMPADLKKILDANTGLEFSKQIGKVFDGTTAPAIKLARDAGGVFDTLSAAEYAVAVRELQLASRRTGEFFRDWDVLLTPTLAAPPVPIGELQPDAAGRGLMGVVGPLRARWLLKLLGAVKPMAEKSLGFIPYTPVFNVTGQPAMSVPLHWNAAGLPIGMHFVGRYGDEATLFRLAGQLERVRPWFDRAPPGY